VGTHIVDAVAGGARHAELEEERLEGLLAVAGLQVEGRQAQAAVAVGATVALRTRPEDKAHEISTGGESGKPYPFLFQSVRRSAYGRVMHES
jgi:hypothetical protein